VPIARSTTSLSNSPLGPLPLPPIHADPRRSTRLHPLRRLLASLSENAAWLKNLRFTSCRSFSPERAASPLAQSRPPRARALRPTLRPSLTRPTRHLRLPMRYGLHPGSRTAIEHGVDSDAPASAAVLSTISRASPTVRPPLNALLLLLTSRSFPGAAGRSIQARRQLLVARHRVASSPDSLPGDSLGTVGRRCAVSHDTRGARWLPQRSTGA
jgi:hypothetical protein